MNGTNDLQVFLRAKAKESKPEAEVDWELKKNTWLKNIDQLYNQVVAWLEPLVKEKVVRFERKSARLEEEPIGSYEADILKIYIGNQEVIFYPKGTLIIGAQGRIDLKGHRAARSIIFNNDQWFVVERTPKIKTLPFDEQSFQDILSEVME